MFPLLMTFLHFLSSFPPWIYLDSKDVLSCRDSDYHISKHLGVFVKCSAPVGRGGGTPYNGLYGEAPPEKGTFFRLQVYKRVGISQVVVYKRVGKSVI